MGLLYAVAQATEMIKKNEVAVDLDVGDKIIIKTKEKGRFKRREIKGKVISNQDNHNFFIVHTGKSRTSFLKIDAMIGAIEIKKIS